MAQGRVVKGRGLRTGVRRTLSRPIAARGHEEDEEDGQPGERQGGDDGVDVALSVAGPDEVESSDLEEESEPVDGIGLPGEVVGRGEGE